MVKRAQRASGAVIEKRVAIGSKSERVAVVLRDASGREWVLRRPTGHPFHDRVLRALVGRDIEATGKASGATLFVETWKDLGTTKTE